MTVLYYITRSYPLYKKTGGSLMREAQVNFLRKKFDKLVVVMPNYNSAELVNKKDVIQIPFYNYPRISELFERVGIYEDYLDNWVNRAYAFLEISINQEDIIFSTCGGELASIKLGSRLKQKSNCKFLVNFHDPIDYTTVDNSIVDNRIHIKRDYLERKYLANADFIITSSKGYKQSLLDKYPFLNGKIDWVHFGYIDRFKKYSRVKDGVFRIAFSGSLTKVQSPELLIEAFDRFSFPKKKIEILFIGDNRNYRLSSNSEHVIFIDSMDRDIFLKYMKNYVDVGFVSLTNEYLGACVPSKIFEYINLELPIIGALPDGDAKEIIEKGYGVCCHYQDIECLTLAIKHMLDETNYTQYKTNLSKDVASWHFNKRQADVFEMIARAAK
jgi:glycosyltransferase involved in cell wall biosynthesis